MSSKKKKKKKKKKSYEGQRLGVHNGENRTMGPRTEPWGTPYKRGERVDRIS